MHFSTIFWQNLHKGQKLAFLRPSNFSLYLVLHPVLPCRECPGTIESVLKAHANKNIISLELSTKINPDLKGQLWPFV